MLIKGDLFKTIANIKCYSNEYTDVLSNVDKEDLIIYIRKHKLESWPDPEYKFFFPKLKNFIFVPSKYLFAIKKYEL